MNAEKDAAESQLLANIKRDLPTLQALAREVTGHWDEEDLVYRFWHQSFKVYGIQDLTLRIVEALERIAPDGTEFDAWFKTIIAEGTGKEFSVDHNDRWLDETRPMVEAFWHADYMLRMAVKYGEQIDDLPPALPSGWAALLTLYGIR